MALKQASRLIVPGRSGLPAFDPPIVDTFTRANSGTLGASWLGPSGSPFARSDINSNQVGPDGTGNNGADYYAAAGASLAFDAAFKVAAWGSSSQAILEFLTQTGIGTGVDTFRGFAIVPRMNDAVNPYYDIYHSTAGNGYTGYGYVTSALLPATAAAGMSMGMRVFNAANTPYECYFRASDSDPWTLVYSGSVGTTLTAMFAGIRMDFTTGGTERFDDFRHYLHSATTNNIDPKPPRFTRKTRERIMKPRILAAGGGPFGVLGAPAVGFQIIDGGGQTMQLDQGGGSVLPTGSVAIPGGGQALTLTQGGGSLLPQPVTISGGGQALTFTQGGGQLNGTIPGGANTMQLDQGAGRLLPGTVSVPGGSNTMTFTQGAGEVIPAPAYILGGSQQMQLTQGGGSLIPQPSTIPGGGQTPTFSQGGGNVIPGFGTIPGGGQTLSLAQGGGTLVPTGTVPVPGGGQTMTLTQGGGSVTQFVGIPPATWRNLTGVGQ